MPTVRNASGEIAVVLMGSALAVAAFVAVSLSALLSRRGHRIVALRQALEAERGAREKLAGALHDESVQTLLVAGQELQDARRGEPGALDRAETAVRLTIARLRAEIIDLHPHVLDHAGLEPALEDLARRWSARSGIPIRTRIDRCATGQHDGLLFSVAEELLANVVRHASARSVDLELGACPGRISLRVSDDGTGAHGQLGLATITERVQAIGGQLEVRAEVGHGTTAVATLPAGEHHAIGGRVTIR